MSTTFQAHIQSGSADPDCPENIIPEDIKKAAKLWESKGEAASEEILSLLSKFLTANFVPSNIPSLEELIEETDDIDAENVMVTGFSFGEEPLPSVDAQATYRLTTSRPLDNDALEEWQDDEGEFLTDCVNFAWSFEDPSGRWSNVLGDHEGAGVEIQD